jgi:hypothetical protein
VLDAFLAGSCPDVDCHTSARSSSIFHVWALSARSPSAPLSLSRAFPKQKLHVHYEHIPACLPTSAERMRQVGRTRHFRSVTCFTITFFVGSRKRSEEHELTGQGSRCCSSIPISMMDACMRAESHERSSRLCVPAGGNSPADPPIDLHGEGKLGPLERCLGRENCRCLLLSEGVCRGRSVISEPNGKLRTHRKSVCHSAGNHFSNRT